MALYHVDLTATNTVQDPFQLQTYLARTIPGTELQYINASLGNSGTNVYSVFTSASLTSAQFDTLTAAFATYTDPTVPPATLTSFTGAITATGTVSAPVMLLATLSTNYNGATGLVMYTNAATTGSLPGYSMQLRSNDADYPAARLSIGNTASSVSYDSKLALYTLNTNEKSTFERLDLSASATGAQLSWVTGGTGSSRPLTIYGSTTFANSGAVLFAGPATTMTGNLMVGSTLTAATGSLTYLTATTISSASISATLGTFLFLSTATLTTSSLTATSADVVSLLASTLTAGQLSAPVGAIVSLSTSTLTAGSFSAPVGSLTNLAASTITTGSLSANIGSIVSLATTTLTAGSFSAPVGSLTTLAASTITTGSLSANIGSVTFATASTITAGSLTANLASVTSVSASILAARSLSSTYGSILSVTAATVTTGALFATEFALGASTVSAAGFTAPYGSMTTLMAGTITVGSLAATLGFVSSLVVSSLSVTSLSATNLIGSTITAASLSSTLGNVVNLTSSTITTGSLSAPVGSITNITASTITAASLSVTQLANSTITTGSLSALVGSITNLTASTITAASLSVTQLATSTITTGSLSAPVGSVTNFTAATVTTGSLLTNNGSVLTLFASSVTAASLSATIGSVVNLTSATITSGSVSAPFGSLTNFSAATITADSFTAPVGNLTNLAASTITTGSLSAGTCNIISLVTSTLAAGFCRVSGTVLSVGGGAAINATALLNIAGSNSTVNIIANNDQNQYFQFSNNLVFAGVQSTVVKGLSISAGGQVGINNVSPAFGLDVAGTARVITGTLGTLAGDQVLIHNLTGRVNNSLQLQGLVRRTAPGTDWTSSTFRLQTVVDITSMSYQDFNAGGNAGAIAWGNGSVEGARLNNGNLSVIGNLTVGTTLSASRISATNSNVSAILTASTATASSLTTTLGSISTLFASTATTGSFNTTFGSVSTLYASTATTGSFNTTLLSASTATVNNALIVPGTQTNTGVIVATGVGSLLMRAYDVSAISASLSDPDHVRGRNYFTSLVSSIAYPADPNGVNIGGQTANYLVRFIGAIRANTSDTYTFQVIVSDGARLYVNHTKVIDAWILQAGVATYTGTIALTAGMWVPFLADWVHAISTSAFTITYRNTTNQTTFVPLTHNTAANGLQMAWDLFEMAPTQHSTMFVGGFLNLNGPLNMTLDTAARPPAAGDVSVFADSSDGMIKGVQASGIVQNMMFGSEFFTGSSTTAATNNSTTTYLTFATFTTPVLAGGTYLASWTYQASQSSTNGRIDIEVYVDNAQTEDSLLNVLVNRGTTTQSNHRAVVLGPGTHSGSLRYKATSQGTTTLIAFRFCLYRAA